MAEGSGHAYSRSVTGIDDRPWKVGTSPFPGPSSALRQLSAAWREKEIRDGLYTRAEMKEFELGNQAAEVSWAPPPGQLSHPWTQLAKDINSGDVVAGIELYENRRDHFWFLEGLVRNPAPEFKGVGAAVVDAAIAWVMHFLDDIKSSKGVRVHAMARDLGAVKWWTGYFGRPPDFTDAFVKTPSYHFPAVGWEVRPTAEPEMST